MTKEELHEWERWVADLRKAAEAFAENRALDAASRQQYLKSIKTYSWLILQNMYEGTMSPADAKDAMYTLRNEVLEASRKDLSQLGRLFSRLLKESGPSLAELEAKYGAVVDSELAAAGKRLSEEQRFARICEKIVEAGGRDRGWVTRLSGPLATAAKMVHTLTWFITIAHVITAEDKLDAAGRVAFTWAGAKAGAWAGAAVCVETGPGMGICAIIGGIIGGFGGDFLYDHAKSMFAFVMGVLVVPIGMRVRPRTSFDLLKHR